MPTKPFVAAGNDGISIPRGCVHPHRTCRLRSVYNQTCTNLDSALAQARNIHDRTRSVLHTAHRNHRSTLINCLNEFYKKGCSIKRDVKKKTPPRPEWRVFLEIQPTVVSLLWRSLALLSILVSFSADGDDAIEF
jgi:hypothetical protein